MSATTDTTHPQFSSLPVTGTTLLDLVLQLDLHTNSEKDTVQAVLELVATHRLELKGTFCNCHLPIH